MCQAPAEIVILLKDDEGNLFFDIVSDDMLTKVKSIITVNDNKLDLSKDIEFKKENLSKKEVEERGYAKILCGKYSDDDEWVEIKEINTGKVHTIEVYDEIKEDKNFEEVITLILDEIDIDLP